MPDYVTRVILDPAGAQTGEQKANASFDRVVDRSRAARDSVEALSKQFEQLAAGISPAIEREAELYRATELVTRAQLAGIATESEAIRVLEAKRAAIAANVVTFDTVLAQMKEETALLRLDDAERERVVGLREAENALRKEGIALSVEERAALRAEIVTQQELRAAKAAGGAGAGGETGVKGLGGALLGGGGGGLGGVVIGGLAVGEVAKLGNEYQNLENRIRLVTTGSAELGRVTEELFDVAQHTRSGWAETAEAYQRLTGATKALHLSETERVNIVRELNELGVESGVSNQEAANGIRQLLQGLSAGTLRGQDLRAALEDIPALGQAIADGLGVTIGQLRQMGEDGKLTATNIIGALDRVRGKADADFASTKTTIGQSLTELNNEFLHLIATLQPVFDALAGVIEVIAKALEAVAPVLHLVGDAIGFVADHAVLAGVALAPVAPFMAAIIALPTVLHYAGEAMSWIGDKLGSLADAVGLGGDSMHDFLEKTLKLQEQMDAITDSIDKSAASFNTYAFLMRDGVNVQALNAKVIVHDLGVEIRNTTQAMVYSKDILDDYATQVKTFTRDIITEIHRLQQEEKKAAEVKKEASRKAAEESKQLDHELAQLEAHEGAAAAAAEKLAKANDILARAVHAHKITAHEANEIHVATIANIAAEELGAHKFSETMKSVTEDLKKYDALQRSITGLPKAKSGLGTLDLEEEIKRADELIDRQNKAHDALKKWANDASWSKGIKDGLGQIREEGLKVGTAIESAVVNSVKKLSDEIVDLVTTGKANFSDLADSILKELARIATNALLAQLLGAVGFGSTSENSLAALLGAAPKHQTGTDYVVPGSGGTDSQVQIFRATPGERVTVQTPAQQLEAAASRGVVGAGARPVVNLRNVNVLDPRMIPAALATADGQAAIYNAIAARPELIRAAMRSRRR